MYCPLVGFHRIQSVTICQGYQTNLLHVRVLICGEGAVPMGAGESNYILPNLTLSSRVYSLESCLWPLELVETQTALFRLSCQSDLAHFEGISVGGRMHALSI